MDEEITPYDYIEIRGELLRALVRGQRARALLSQDICDGVIARFPCLEKTLDYFCILC